MEVEIPEQYHNMNTSLTQKHNKSGKTNFYICLKDYEILQC